MTEENLRRDSLPEAVVLQEGKITKRAEISSLCLEPSCDLWHPPVCQNYKSESGCKFGENCVFRHTTADRHPSKKSKKSDGKRSIALLKESEQLGCVSQDTEPPKKSILRKSGNWDRIAPSHSPWAHGTKSKFGKESVHREELFRSVNLKNAICVRQKLRIGQTRTMRPQRSMGFSEKMCRSSKQGTRPRFFTPRLKHG